MLKLQSQGSPSCLWFASGFILIYINICEALLMSQEADLSTRITLLENLLPPTLPFRFIRSGICVWSFPTVDKKHEKNTLPLITEANTNSQAQGGWVKPTTLSRSPLYSSAYSNHSWKQIAGLLYYIRKAGLVQNIMVCILTLFPLQNQFSHIWF